MKRHKTGVPGVFYREHEDRLHRGEPDKYFIIRYMRFGKQTDAGVGWASQGMTLAKATAKRETYLENQKRGGPTSPKDEKEAVKQEREAKAEDDRRNLPFSMVAEQYMQWARGNKKSWAHDERLYRLHINPVIGDKRLTDITPADVERIKTKTSEKGRAQATVRHALQLVRHTFNFADRHGLFEGTNPTKHVKFPNPDNARQRFLSYDEADKLLVALWQMDTATHDMALLSLYTGMRLGECTGLLWSCVDFEHGMITAQDTKGGFSRRVHMSEQVREMMERRRAAFTGTGLVFPSPRTGERLRDPSKYFKRAVKELGFNEGVTDPRQKVTFHSLRHSFCSWLAMQGEQLQVIQELAGHRSITMTLRYSHLIPDHKQAAVEKLGQRAKAKILPFAKQA